MKDYIVIVALADEIGDILEEERVMLAAHNADEAARLALAETFLEADREGERVVVYSVYVETEFSRGEING